MALFFNGRLHVTPAVMSRVDDSALANQNLASGNVLAILGHSSGGAPKQALAFGSPSEAAATLRGGELLTAVQKAFAPSPDTGAPARVIAVRVNPASQSLLTLFDANNKPAVELNSTDYGLYTNQIKVKVESASVAGKKITTQYGQDYYTQDNLARNAFSVQYTGAETSAQITVDNTQVKLEAPIGTVAATLDLSAYPTIQSVADAINAVSDFSAAVLDGNGEKPALNALDGVQAQDVSQAYTVTAHLQAVVDWFNGRAEGYVTARRADGAGAAPLNADWAYLAGGADGETTNQDWSNAYTVLQTEDVQWVVPLSADAGIHAMNDAHCTFMSVVAERERRGFVGGPIGQSIEDVVSAAKALNSARTAECAFGYYDYDASGKLTLYAPYMFAALVGAGFAGSDPGEALTNKALAIRGLEKKLRTPTDTDTLIEGGVLCISETPNGFKVVKSVSTWLNDDNYDKVEVSVGSAVDYVARTVRETVQSLLGHKANPLTIAEAVSRADTTLRELATPAPQGPGVLVGDADHPAFKGLTATLNGETMAIRFQCSPVIPINYIPISIYAVPYSGAASA